MGAWSLYFLAKIGLYWAQLIGLHWGLNLLFAAALAWPLQQPRLRLARHVLAVPVAVALLYHDSFLPPLARAWSQLGALASFSAAYWLELAGRLVAWPVLAALALLVLLYLALRRRLRFATLAFAGLLSAALLPAPGFWARGADPAPTLNPRADTGAPLEPGQLSARLAGFYATEADKLAPLPPGVTPAFDVIVLSICSLSWEDLDEVRLRDAPLLSRFDLVFRQFNSAASYSGPALLRLLRASCGQLPQSALYDAAPAQCHLFGNLAQAGYESALLMNHDGHFDNFAEQLRNLGGLGVAPTTDRGAPVAMQAFDGTPIQADFDVLARWWQPRSSSVAPLALLYNSVTLHDGNRVPGLQSLRSRDTFKPRLTKLLADLERFIALIEASKRPTLLLLVPEHGGAIRGDAVQISGLRELPTVGITSVPAAAKLIGFEGFSSGGGPVVVDKPSSYFALASLVATLMPLGRTLDGRAQLEAIARELPGTDWVSENDGTVLMRQGERSYLRSPDGSWTAY